MKELTDQYLLIIIFILVIIITITLGVVITDNIPCFLKHLYISQLLLLMHFVLEFNIIHCLYWWFRYKTITVQFFISICTISLKEWILFKFEPDARYLCAWNFRSMLHEVKFLHCYFVFGLCIRRPCHGTTTLVLEVRTFCKCLIFRYKNFCC